MRLQKSFFIAPIFFMLMVALSACGSAVSGVQPTGEAREVETDLPSETSEPAAISLEAIEDRKGCEVSAPPAELGLDEFYTKYCDADGIIIAASDNVDDFAVKEGWYVVMNFLAPLPDARASLVANGAQLTIYDSNREDLRDVPEYYTLSFDTNDFAAGLGGTLSNPVSVTTEQDLLCNRTTTYRLLTALAAWRCARLITPDPLSRVLSLLLVTNTLMFTGLAASVSYDNLTNLLAALAIAQLLAFLAVRRGATLLGFGLAVLAGCLTKLAFLPLAAILAATLLWRERRALRDAPARCVAWLRVGGATRVLAAATWRVFLSASSQIVPRSRASSCRASFMS